MEKELNQRLLLCEVYRVNILNQILELANGIVTDEKLSKNDILEQLLDLIETTHLDEQFCYRGAMEC